MSDISRFVQLTNRVITVVQTAREGLVLWIFVDTCLFRLTFHFDRYLQITTINRRPEPFDCHLRDLVR
ncbi:hypothetical protein HALDL1_01025 (plasmid) [Halobacterium sp. DL1]|nr:hypothetical protein HALDL1_01025 [Halobacterium sp. DL1]